MTEKEINADKLELLAKKKFSNYDEMYLVVDFLNKTLKHKKVMFGLSKKEDQMTFSIYEV